MKKNPLTQLQQFGQSVWLDFLHRRMFATGELAALIEEDGLRGVTSNPAIFQKAIGESSTYDEAIAALAKEGKGSEEIYQTLVVEDVRQAADLLRPLYDATEGEHGFVSLEVNPHLAHDTEGTVSEARMFWRLLDRPNVLIKVPATEEGLPAIQQLIGEGINVNVTLLFGLPRYRQVATAYLAGIALRISRGEPLHRVASVASFFLSRIDVLVDDILEKRERAGGEAGKRAAALKGRVAIACARKAYEIYQEIYDVEVFFKMAAAGARSQRLLWASTSTKNPAYADLMYVEPLIGPATINTLPLETINAYRDHGMPAERLQLEQELTAQVLADLPGLGIDLDEVSQRLEDEGVEKFIRPFDTLMATIDRQRIKALS